MGGFGDPLFDEELFGFDEGAAEPPSVPGEPGGRLIVEVAGVSRFIFPNSLEIDEEAQGRSTGAVTIQSWPGGSPPQIGQTVKFKWDEFVLFAGTIDEIEYNNPNGTRLIEWKLKCVDWNQIADRFTVTSSFENATFQEIVTDLLENYLGQEGVTAGIIPTGPTFARVVYPGMQVSECFNELSSLTGYIWNIRYEDKKLDFAPIGTHAAPISITYGNGLYRNPLFRKNRNQFADSVFILGGRDTSVPQTEDFTGDGVNRNFTLAFKVAKEPTITLDRGSGPVAETVGIKGIDSGFQWYWSVDDAVIVQDKAETVLSSSDSLEVVYQGFFPIFLQLDALSAIVERQTAEGGTGRYEIVEKDEAIDSNLLALDRAGGILRRQSVIPTEFSFQTDTKLSNLVAQMRAGQTISISDTVVIGIEGSFFIQGQTIKDRNGVDLVIDVRAVDSEKVESWSDYFAKLLRAGKRTTLRGNEQLIATRSFTGEQVIFADSISEVHGAPVSTVCDAEVGYSEVTTC